MRPKVREDNSHSGESESEANEKPFIIVDGSNIAYGGGKFEQPQLWVIHKVRSDLSDNGYSHTTLVDATLRHRIDDQDGLEKLISSDQVQQTPARTAADSYIIQLANKMKRDKKMVKVLTNDVKMIESYEGTLERIAPVILNVLDQQEIFYEPPLESPNITKVEFDGFNEKDNLVPKKVDEQIKQESKIHPDLMKSFIQYLRKHKSLGEGKIVPFASLANSLHKSHGGNFCEKFGYRKPKDFVLDLQREGYISIVEDRDPLFIRIER